METDIAAELENYLDALRLYGADPAPLSAQAQALVALSDSEFEAALRAFHIAANHPAYYTTTCDCDCDFGALLLEVLADECGEVCRRRRLYLGAHRRAATFASYATSGGEGVARSLDVERIARKIEDVEARSHV